MPNYPNLPKQYPKTINIRTRKSLTPKELNLYHNDIYVIYKWLENNFSWEIANKIFFKFGGISKTNPVVPLLKELRFIWTNSNKIINPTDNTLSGATLRITKENNYTERIFHATSGRCSSRYLEFEGGEITKPLGEEHHGWWYKDCLPRNTPLDPIDIRDRCANWWFCKSKHNGNMLCCLKSECNNPNHAKRLVCEMCRYNHQEDCLKKIDRITGEVITPPQSVDNFPSTGRKNYYDEYSLTTLEKFKANPSLLDELTLSPQQELHFWKALTYYKEDIRKELKVRAICIGTSKDSDNKTIVDNYFTFPKNPPILKKYFSIEETNAICNEYNGIYGLSNGIMMIKKPKGTTYEKARIFTDNLKRYIIKKKCNGTSLLFLEKGENMSNSFIYEFVKSLDHDIINYDIFRFLRMMMKLGLRENENRGCSNANAIKSLFGNNCDKLSERFYWFIRNTFYEIIDDTYDADRRFKKEYITPKRRNNKKQKRISNPKITKNIFSFNHDHYIEVDDWDYILE